MRADTRARLEKVEHVVRLVAAEIGVHPGAIGWRFVVEFDEGAVDAETLAFRALIEDRLYLLS